MQIRAAVLTLLTIGLLTACNEADTPFPFQPNLPDDFNRSTDYQLGGNREELLGDVAMFTHEIYNEHFNGLVAQYVVCFDSVGRCLELYYRSREANQRYTFQYDSLGRRVEETCYLDSAGTPYDSITTSHTHTTYRYSRNGRTCKARISSPDGKHYTFRLRYNRNGQLHRFIYPDGSRLTYDYDTAGRLLRTTYPDASHETYSYNDDGSLNGIKGRTGIWEWFIAPDTKATYDTLGRRTEEISYQTTDGNKTPVVTSYTYDDHNNWIRRTVAGISSPTRIDNRTFKYYTQ